MTFVPPILTTSWFNRPATAVAPDLIGCTLVRQFDDGRQLRGQIVETEAYEPNDPACHAYRKRTPRNAIMFGPPGHTYVYQIYGIYHCLNIVTDAAEVPSAVLLRALRLEPLPTWLAVEQDKPHRLAAGPGKLCRALAIDRALNAQPLTTDAALWIESRSPDWQPTLVQTTRIGIKQGAELPWRWYLADCPAVSKR